MLKDFYRDKIFLKGFFSGLLLMMIIVLISTAVLFNQQIVDVFNLFSNNRIDVVIQEAAGGREVEPGSNLTITFAENMVEDELLATTRKNDDLIVLDPFVPHSYRWTDRRTILVLPEKPLKPATDYKLKIKPALFSEEPPLSRELVLNFTTSKLRVVSQKMYYQNKRIDYTDLIIRLDFNYSVKPVELKKYLKVYTSNKNELLSEKEYLISDNRASTTINLLIKDVELSDTVRDIRVNILPGLVCEDGTNALSGKYIKYFTLFPRESLKVERIYADSNLEQGSIIIEFSDTIEEESIKSFIKVDEKIDYRLTVNYDRVYLRSKGFKSGDLYNITIKKGVPSNARLPLKNEIKRVVRIPDLDPMVHFTSPGFYLSSKGNMNLSLETVNVDKVDVRINEIYPNNIVHFLPEANTRSTEKISHLGKNIDSFSLDINNKTNMLKKNTIYLGDYLSDYKQGIFQINIHDNDYYWRNDSRFVVITDIGITAKLSNDELIIWANSMKTLDPLKDAKVSFLSDNNQLIAYGRTDSNGFCKIAGIKNLLEDYRPYIIIVEYGNDFSFLKLSDGHIDLADYNVAGRKYFTDGYEAFIYTDRGVYRPGDKANISMIVRGKNVSVPPIFPLTIKIIDPTGNTYRELTKKTSKMGGVLFDLSLPSYIKTGRYRIVVNAGGEEIGQSVFNVEEFIPDRIKVNIITDREYYRAGDKCEITVQGINLFGPPAVGRNVKASIKHNTYQFSPPTYTSYSFGEKDSEGKEVKSELGTGNLDENGELVYKYSFPEEMKPGNMMKSIIEATVKEDGGRAVSEYKVVDFYPYDTYIGIKPLRDYYGKVNQSYPLNYVLVNSNGEIVPERQIAINIYRLISHGLWRKNNDGEWYYESDTEEDKVFSKNVLSRNSIAKIDFIPTDYGKYKVVMTDLENSSTSSIYFYASGWGYSPWSLTNPDRVEISFDKEKYKVGEKANIQIKTPFTGKAVVTVERDKVYEIQYLDIKNNAALLEMEVKEEWKPNVYITVQLLRSIDSVEEHSPVRAFGTAPLNVDCSDKRLEIELATPDIVRPNTEMKVDIEVPALNEEAYLTLAAVDEGILQLTDFKTPDPFGFFYGKKQLDVASYDLYNLILPELARVTAQSSPSGGDDSYNEMLRKENLNPISADRVKPISLFAGNINLDEKGSGEVSFKVPEFNGTLRLMAVVNNKEFFGSGSSKVIVRNPIILTPTYPRFITPRDKFLIPVAVYNDTGEKGDFKVRLSTIGPVKVSSKDQQTVKLEVADEKMLYFECEAKEAVGKATFTLEAGGNNETVVKEIEIPVRPATQYLTEIMAGNLTTDEEKIIEIDDNKWLPGTEKYLVTISAFPTIKFMDSLAYLLRYPYGCLEQTTSKVFPLLYYDDLARIAEPELFKEGTANYYIQEGIMKIQTMQQKDGSFSYWPVGNYQNRWATIYSSHFLVEARRAGYNVANYVYNRMIDNLTNFVKGEGLTADELQQKVYALYVLALADKADISTMNYIKNHQLKTLYADSRAMLAAAYYYGGKSEIADNLIKYSYNNLGNIKRGSGGNFNSSTRREAIILSVLADIDPEHNSIPFLVEKLTKRVKIGHWGTTQDNAFAFMALGKVLNKHENKAYTGTVYINNTLAREFTNQKNILLDNLQSGDRIRISNSGGGRLYYFIKSSGVPLDNNIKEEDSGLIIRREYLDKKGNKLDLKDIKQGELIIGKLSINSQVGRLENVLIADMLPAGLEIENPRLSSRSQPGWLDSKTTINPQYLDMRDDRLLLFTDIEDNKEFNFYYTMRAVTAGDFILPPVKAECMYEPGIFSINGSGSIKVSK